MAYLPAGLHIDLEQTVDIRLVIARHLTPAIIDVCPIDVALRSAYFLEANRLLAT